MVLTELEVGDVWCAWSPDAALRSARGTGAVTLRAAHQVGGILKYAGPDDPVASRYAHYMLTKEGLMERPYDESGLQSLFGYGRAAHERSGGICQLCGCGAGPDVDFDLWRQFTIEHLIGDRQGGYPGRIRRAVEARFPHLPEGERADLATRIHEANVVTACQFCNSTTSRDRAPFSMEEIIGELPHDPEEAMVTVAEKLQVILETKRDKVRWKLQSVYRTFTRDIRPTLLRRREEEPSLREPRDLSGLDVMDTAPLKRD